MLCRLRAVRFELDLFLKIQKVADQDINTPSIYLILWSLGRIDKGIKLFANPIKGQHSHMYNATHAKC
jgi:hypothetical protein